MTYEEVAEAIKNGTDTVVLSIGALEQHGPHGVLGVDSFCALEVAERVAPKLHALLAPLIFFGASSGHLSFAGTISIRPETLSELTKDVCRSLVRHGFKKIVFLNGNEPNYYPIMSAIREVREETGVIITVTNWYSAVMDIWRDLRGIKGTERERWKWSYFMAHGGFLETSVAMSYKEDIFRMDRATVYPSDRREAFASPIVTMPFKMEEVCKDGSYGDPRGASGELGEAIAEIAAERIAESLKKLFTTAEKPPI